MKTCKVLGMRDKGWRSAVIGVAGVDFFSVAIAAIANLTVIGVTQIQVLVRAPFLTICVVLGSASSEHRANITCLAELSRALGIM